MKTNLKVQEPLESKKTSSFGVRFLNCLSEFLAGTDTLLAEQVVLGLFPNSEKEIHSKN